MTKLVINSLIHKVKQLIMTQLMIVGLLGIILLVVTGVNAAIATWVGGVTYVLPCYLYAKKLFADVSAQAIKRIITIFYVGEIIKLLVSVGLFVGLYRIYHFPILPYFLGYLFAALTFCIAPVWLMAEKNQVNT